MAYHETFWVVVGTSAPVIGLGLVITAGQARTAYREAATVHRLPLPQRRWRGLLGIREEPFPETRFARAAILWFAYGLAAELVAFFYALLNLATGTDGGALQLGFVFSAFGIFAVFPAGMDVVRQQEENRRPKAPSDPVGQGPDDGGFYLADELPGAGLEPGRVIRRKNAAAAWLRRWRALIGRGRTVRLKRRAHVADALVPGDEERGLGQQQAAVSLSAMTDEHTAISDAALEGIRNLLDAGKNYGIGITFEPDEHGWSVGYMEGMGGGPLASAYDLETAVRAAERPLDELAHRLAENARDRA